MKKLKEWQSKQIYKRWRDYAVGIEYHDWLESIVFNDIFGLGKKKKN